MPLPQGNMTGGWKSSSPICFGSVFAVIGVPVFTVLHTPLGEVLSHANFAVAVIRTCAAHREVSQRLKCEASLTFTMFDTIDLLMLLARTVMQIPVLSSGQAFQVI